MLHNPDMRQFEANLPVVFCGVMRQPAAVSVETQ